MRLSLSFCFLSPAKTIFVPGMNLRGFFRYSSKVSALQMMPLSLLAYDTRISVFPMSIEFFSRQKTVVVDDRLGVGVASCLSSLSAEEAV